jgi:hypothetical protein
LGCRLDFPGLKNCHWGAGWTSQALKNVQTTLSGLPRAEKLSFLVRERSQQPKNFFLAAGWPAAVDLRFFRLAGSAAGAPKTFFRPAAGQPALQKLFFSAWPASRHPKNYFSALGRSAGARLNYFSASGWPAGAPKTFFQRLAGLPAPKSHFFNPG